MKANQKVLNTILLGSILSASVNMTACSFIPFVADSAKMNTSGNFGIPATQRTVAQRLEDESIEATAIINLKNIDTAISESSRIEVDCFDDKVLLTGEVPNETAKQTVQEVVASMPEVTAIYNELKVGRKHSLSYKLHDAYINAKISQRIIFSKEINLSQVDITTENGVVYVMGRVTEYQQRHLIELANQTEGVLELVLLTTILPDTALSSATLTYPQQQQIGQASQPLIESAANISTQVALPQPTIQNQVAQAPVIENQNAIIQNQAVSDQLTQGVTEYTEEATQAVSDGASQYLPNILTAPAVRSDQ